jgi:hypothetical protein
MRQGLLSIIVTMYFISINMEDGRKTESCLSLLRYDEHENYYNEKGLPCNPPSDRSGDDSYGNSKNENKSQMIMEIILLINGLMSMKKEVMMGMIKFRNTIAYLQMQVT